MEMSIARCHLESRGIFVSITSRAIGWEKTQKFPYIVAAQSSRRVFHRLISSSFQALTAEYRRKPIICRENSTPMSLKVSADSEGKTSAQPLTSEQIMSLLADTHRKKLTEKLSEANQQNRFLQKQLLITEDALVKFRSELAAMELQVQALVRLANEIAKSGIPRGSRKIGGKFIHSHLVARLEAVHEQLKEQIKDVDAAKPKEVSLFWTGMAESVQVMGSFDGWTEGKYLSPEGTDSFTKFSTTLMLRPGRYEIKFIVDGKWRVSEAFPVTGEGFMINNLLVVK